MTETGFANIVDDNVKNVFHIARQIAKENLHQYLGAPHLLKALLHKDAGLIPVIKGLDKDYYYIEEWADVRLEAYPKTGPVANISSDKNTDAVLQEADDLRLKFNKDLTDAKLLLAALVTPGVAFSYEQLKSLPLQREELLDAEIKKVDFSSITKGNGQKTNTATNNQYALLKYCIEKTDKVYLAKKDRIIGRDREIRMMSEVLSRRTKPNVLLIGEPGVGKTSLVDGFAFAIQQKKV